jgi:hypothetical protein
MHAYVNNAMSRGQARIGTACCYARDSAGRVREEASIDFKPQPENRVAQSVAAVNCQSSVP